MLKNYFIIALRNLLKHKVFSAINILGLSVGITCCSILALYIQDELSYDRHFEDSERIFRVTTEIREGDAAPEYLQRTSPPIAMAMQADFPEVEAATRIVNPPEVERHLIRYGNETFYEKTGYLVDSTFFKVFSYELAEGNPKTALSGRSPIILSHQLARKLFGDESGINENIIVTSGFSSDTFRVTGVLKPISRKSHVNADFYMSMNSDGWGDLINGMTTWSGQNFMFTYVKLREGTSTEALAEKFTPWIEKHGGDEMRAMGRKKRLGLQPLKDVHLHSNHFAFNLDLAPTGSIWYIYVMGSVAVFILLLGCINFMNLTTARATQRAAEVGVRKTMGAGQRELIGQFMGESLATVLIAILVSVVLVQFVLPFFNMFATRSLSITSENISFYIIALTIIGLFTGVVSGIYPSFFLAAFEPAIVLKNKGVLNSSSSWMRKGLVVIQFVIAITLIGASFVIHQQLAFVQDQHLGFAVDHRIMIPMRTPEAKREYTLLKMQFEQVTGVKKVSASTSLPFTPLLRDIRLHKADGNMDNGEHHFICNIDEDYFQMLDIPLVAGRHLNRDIDRQTENFSRIMVNRMSLRKLGITEEEASGQKLYWTGRLSGATTETTLIFEIVGVVDDFHQNSLHSGIDPILFLLPESRDNYVFMGISIEPGTFKQVTSGFETIWKTHVPATPFEAQFLSEEVQRKYEHDRQISLVISLFTSIAIAISCLGLYGLSVFVTQRRMKEIGVRKVLGASTFSIVRMLSLEFILLVAVAFFLAAPLAYYAMERWLENFAYRIDLQWSIFVVAGLISFAIAWLTVSVEAIRAASANPVNSLRND